METIELFVGTELLIGGKKYVVREKTCNQSEDCKHCNYNQEVMVDVSMKHECRRDQKCVYFEEVKDE